MNNFDIRHDIAQVIQAKKNTIELLIKQKEIHIQNVNIFVQRVNVFINSIDSAIEAEKNAIEAIYASANGQISQQYQQPKPAPTPQETKPGNKELKTEVKVEVIEAPIKDVLTGNIPPAQPIIDNLNGTNGQ